MLNTEAARLLSFPMVRDRTSLSEMTIRRMMERGEFPAPVRISANRVAWPEAEIASWIASKVGSKREAA